MAQPNLRLADGTERRKLPRKVRFTKKSLDAIKPPASGRTHVYDDKTPGLAFTVTAADSRAFYIYRRIDGKPARLKIGDYPPWTIEQARDHVAKLQGQIADGRNPAEERRNKRGEMTFAELFNVYLERHAKPRKKTWREDEQKFNLHLPDWHNRKVSTIRKADVAGLVSRIGTDKDNPRPGAANRTLALVSAVFNFGIDELGIEVVNPARGVRKFSETQRERFLNAEELKRFYASLERETGRFQDFFELLLLTAARSGNVKRMRWDQLDLTAGSGGVWIIPATEAKAGKPIVVPLVMRAVEILANRRSEAEARAVKLAEKEGGDPTLNPWVFPSHRRNPKHPHLAEVKSAWERIVTRAKLADVRVHDLRHTAATWQAKAGASLLSIGKALGHARPTTTQIYTQSELEQVRQAVEGGASGILQAAGKVGPAVTPTKGKTRQKAGKPKRRQRRKVSKA